MGNKYIEAYHSRKAEAAKAPSKKLETKTPPPEFLPTTAPVEDEGSPAVMTTAPNGPRELTFTSGALKTASFDGKQVKVMFANGLTATYDNFTEAQFTEWEKAKSGAAWFHNNVRQKSKDHPEVKNG